MWTRTQCFCSKSTKAWGQWTWICNKLNSRACGQAQQSLRERANFELDPQKGGKTQRPNSLGSFNTSPSKSLERWTACSKVETLWMFIRTTGAPTGLSTPRMSIPRVVWAGAFNLAIRRVATFRQNGSDTIALTEKVKWRLNTLSEKSLACPSPT